MSGRPSARETFNFYNSLLCLVKALENQYTTIDLRNDSSISGKIIHVDGFMNVVLADAVFYDGRDKEYYFESFFLQSRNIRHFHIPEAMNIVDTIKEGVMWKPKPRSEVKKPYSSKMKRALKNHLETVASLGKNSEADEA